MDYQAELHQAGHHAGKHSWHGENHGYYQLSHATAFTKMIQTGLVKILRNIVDLQRQVRRITVIGEQVQSVKNEAVPNLHCEQLDLFAQPELKETNPKTATKTSDQIALGKEKQLQQLTLDLQQRFGKDAIFKGANLQKGSMMLQQHHQIGGHDA